MNNEQAKTAALSWHGEAGGELLPQLTANELAGIVNEAIQQAAGAVPEGWKLVPIEPTPEMLDVVAYVGSLPAKNACCASFVPNDVAGRIYRAMLAA